MSEFRVATRYAKSLLELAEEQGVLEEVHDDMQLFARTCEENREFLLMIKTPILKSDKKQAILREIFSGKMNPLTMAFFNIIARKNRENILSAVAREFHLQYNVFKGIVEAKVVTTFPLDDKLRARFTDIVKELVGKKVELNEVVDKDLIGGYILTVGDKQIDDSLQSKLKELKLDFTHNAYVKAF